MNKLNKIFVFIFCTAAIMGAASVYAYTDDEFSGLEMKSANNMDTMIPLMYAG